MGHLNHERLGHPTTPPNWLKFGADMGELANDMSRRGDIVVHASPAAGHGAPACWVPATAEMDINIDVVFGEGYNPELISDLRIRKNQFDYPVLMGALSHEIMHSIHSSLDLLKDLQAEKDASVRTLATAMEETRIEARGIKLFPKNKSFFRACALKLVMGDIEEETDFAGGGMISFSHLILLTLARVDAGVLKHKDVKLIQDAADKVFDKDTMRKLQGIWLRAQAHNDDHNGVVLCDLAREWIQLLEDAGHDTSPQDADIPDWLKEMLKGMAGEPGDGGEGGEQSEGSGGGGSILEIMAEATETDAGADGNEQAAAEHSEEVASAKGAAAAEAKKHKEEASKIFGRGTGPAGSSSYSRLVKEREPSPEERIAAVSLSKALEKARYRDRIQIKRTSVVPPGRLGARAAIAAAEQKSRGVDVTAEPWSRKQRKHAEDPHLTVGVLVDISGSMSSAMEPMASAAWILSEATRRVQGTCAMVYYGNACFSVLKPGQHLNKVAVYDAPDGTERFNQAFQALDGATNLLNSSGARLLVIVSDLHYTGPERDATEKWIKRCRKEGVAVIVAPFGYDDSARGLIKHVGAGVELLGNEKTKGGIVKAAEQIGAAAVRQLEAASR